MSDVLDCYPPYCSLCQAEHEPCEVSEWGWDYGFPEVEESGD